MSEELMPVRARKPKPTPESKAQIMAMMAPSSTDIDVSGLGLERLHRNLAPGEDAAAALIEFRTEVEAKAAQMLGSVVTEIDVTPEGYVASLRVLA